MKPELGALGGLVVEKAAATQHFQHRAARWMTQPEVTPSRGGLAARGFDELDERQVRLVDRGDIDDNRTILAQSRVKIIASRADI
ncbi:MAG TPA: hypothetical protein VN157_18515 [Caulobacter sp.]|nr:hypothetical protein [Caulobacter sp.]